ncbi:hypothetical protein [Streptomyces sp. NPDC091371]|uniref:hypothetical protein n=1 Tax=Streptomyces sp. NPDC091371 TaxID=3155303 RepID=UPI00341CBB57
MTGDGGPPDDFVPSAEEYEAVRAAVGVVTGGQADGRAPTLNSLLAEWNDVVAELETDGCSDCRPEYDFDVWCRHLLARVWPLLPPRIRALRQPELDRIDERFRPFPKPVAVVVSTWD